MLHEKIRDIDIINQKKESAHVCKNRLLPADGTTLIIKNAVFKVMSVRGDIFTLKFLEFTNFDVKTKRSEFV